LAGHLGVALVSVEQGCAAIHPNVAAPWITERLAGASSSASHDDSSEGFLALLESVRPADDESSSIDASSRQQLSKGTPSRVIVRLKPSLSVPVSSIGALSSSLLASLVLQNLFVAFCRLWSSMMTLSMLILIIRHDVNR
jgi:hypothetical protein